MIAELSGCGVENDLALGIVRLVRQTVRPDLKMVVMSATLAAEAVSAYLGGCPVVTSEGRQYPVEILYEPRPREKPLSLAVSQAVAGLLDRTDGELSCEQEKQVTFIRNQMRGAPLPAGVTLKPNLRTRRQTQEAGGERLLAHTVDSFQGNEADIIVVSLVRNNTLPPGDPSALGFLKEAARLNVLLSRAERLLVLIGSWEFFKQQVAHVPLEDRRQELWHWKKVVTLLEEWFSSGKAIRLTTVLPEAAS